VKCIHIDVSTPVKKSTLIQKTTIREKSSGVEALVGIILFQAYHRPFFVPGVRIQSDSLDLSFAGAVIAGVIGLIVFAAM